MDANGIVVPPGRQSSTGPSVLIKISHKVLTLYPCKDSNAIDYSGAQSLHDSGQHPNIEITQAREG